MSDDAEVVRRVREALFSVRTMRLPLDGARLHVGAAALDSLQRAYRPPGTDGRAPFSFSGMPVVLEEAADPDLIEIRWTVVA